MALKPYISSLLRKTGFLSLAEGLKFMLEKAKYGSINRKFRKSHPSIVFPPPFFIYETYRLRYDQYWLDGLETAKEIIDALEAANGPMPAETKILDWGCGPGRITRHLPDLLPATSLVHGTDYNEEYINWCKTHLTRIKFTQSSINPPLDYPNEYFNIILGLSVFTHLSENNHEQWLNELWRIAKTGSLIYITTQGNSFREKLTQKERELFDAGHLVIRENKKEGNRLYSAFEPESFMRKLINAKFEILKFIPGENLKEPAQDIWILKKKVV